LAYFTFLIFFYFFSFFGPGSETVLGNSHDASAGGEGGWPPSGPVKATLLAVKQKPCRSTAHA
jgi:hypothetical protein